MNKPTPATVHGAPTKAGVWILKVIPISIETAPLIDRQSINRKIVEMIDSFTRKGRKAKVIAPTIPADHAQL